MPIFDITIPVRSGMVAYEGDPPVQLSRVMAIADGAICNVSRLEFGVHTGTHIDAPVHFIEGASGAESIPLDALIGPAFVVDATSVRADIDADAVTRLAIPADATRVIFKTPNSELWNRDGFSRDFIGLTRDAAAMLVARGIVLVAIDYLSIAPFADPAPTHIELLRNGVVVLEGVDLRNVAPGPYELVCLPLLLDGADGAPARALLRRD